MATMKLFGIDCAVLYVDSTAGGTNDGSTPVNALTTLPAVASLAANTAYIIRRGSNLTHTPGTCANSNVAIMGMPKDIDDFYRLVPNEAKTAWDADIAERFVLDIPDANGVTTVFNGEYNAIHRADIQVIGDTNGSFGNSFCQFQFNGKNSRFTKNKYSMKGVDLMNYSATTATVNREVIGNLEFLAPYSLIQDCEFEFSGRRNNPQYNYSYSTRGLVRIEQGNHSKFSDCTLKCGNASAFQNSYFITIGNTENWNLIIENIDMTTYVNIDDLGVGDEDESSVLFGLYCTSTAAYQAVIRNISWEFGGVLGIEKDWSQLGTPKFTYDFNFQDLRGAVIEDISFDTESNWDSNIGTNPFNGLSMVYLTGANNGAGIVSPPRLENWTFKSSVTNPTQMISFNTMPSNVLLKNVTAWTYGTEYAMISGINTDGVSIQNGNFKGRLQINHAASRAHITNWEVTTENSPQILISGDERNGKYNDPGAIGYDANSLVIIENVTLPPLQTTDMISMGDNSMLLIENFNTTPVYDLRGMSTLMVNSEQGVVGNWRCATEDMLLKSVNVQRTGGSAYAIRGNGTGPDYNPAYLGKFPFKGLVRTSGQVGALGSRTVTLYGAYKGYIADPRPENIFMEITVPLGGTGTKRKIVDTRSYGMSWETDASAWTGDSGLTIIKMVVPFEYERLEDVEIRIGSYWNEPGSYFYIDPTPIFS